MALGKLFLASSGSKSKTVSTKSIKRLVQKTVQSNIETKQHQVSFTGIGIGDTPNTTVLTGIAQGDTQRERTGNQFYLTGLHARLWCTSADITNVMRVVMYISRSNVDSELSSLTLHTVIDLDKYTILMDKTVLFGDQHPQKHIMGVSRKFNKGSRKGIRVQFDGSAATDLAQNHLRIAFVTDSGAVAHPTLDGNIRVYFKDA